MAAQIGAYSRLVRVLKFVLPLAALGILGTLFLFSRQIDPGKAIPLAGVDIGRILDEQGVGGARFVSSTPGGGTVRIDAERAMISGENMWAKNFSALVELPAGGVIDIGADLTQYRASQQRLSISGNVHVDASPEITIETDELVATNDFSQIESPGPVKADGRIGHITAGSMQITLDLSANRTGNLVVFQDGITLIYQP